MDTARLDCKSAAACAEGQREGDAGVCCLADDDLGVLIWQKSVSITGLALRPSPARACAFLGGHPGPCVLGSSPGGLVEVAVNTYGL